MKLIGNYNKDLEKYTSFYKFSNPVAPKSNSAWRDLRNIRTLFKLNKQENSEIPLKVESELPILKVPKDIKPQTQNITQNLFKKILDKNQNGFKKLPQKLQSKNQITDNETFEIENLPKNLNFLKNISEQQYPTNLKPQNDKILKKNPTNNFVNKDPLQNKDSDENFREYQKEEDFEPIKIEKDKINKKSGKHSENIRQLRAANFQRKKTGLGGGHIPNNNLIESKLSLLKEMIRKSIEKRPQSADPYQKMPEKTKFNYKKFPESSKPELNEIFADNNLNTDDEIFQIEEPIINNIDTTHSQQKDTRELFFQVYDPPSPRLPKNSVVRAPQNFKIPFFEQIHSKLEEELQKIPINKKTAVPLEMVKPANNDFKQNMDSWSQALFCLECDDIKGAYDVLLKKKDDIFLLRLMSKTGPCFEKMKEKTSMKVLNRILDLYKMNFIEKTCKSFFFEAKEENLLNSLNLDDKKFLMQIMDT